MQWESYVRKPRKKKIRYSYALTEKICKLIESGQTLATICKLEEMPDRRSVYRWRHEHAEFNVKFIVSEQIRLSALQDELLDSTRFMDTPTVYEILANRLKREPNKLESTSFNQQVRMRIEALKYMISKFGGAGASNIDAALNEKPVKVMDYKLEKAADAPKDKRSNIIDLQPAHLKNVKYTKAQQAQIDQFSPK